MAIWRKFAAVLLLLAWPSAMAEALTYKEFSHDQLKPFHPSLSSKAQLGRPVQKRGLAAAPNLDNGLGRTPQMGWNSWNRFHCEINETLIMETADALVSTGLAALGYEYVNIDDCWAALARDPKGNLLARPLTFPSGIKVLADYVHSLGLKLGIYSDAGFLTCAGQPGSLTYERQDAQAFASWGVDYLKYDNCYTDLSKPEKRYPRMRDALNATGRQIFFSLCEWGVDSPAIWGRKVGNSWRTTLDIYDSWSRIVDLANQNNAWAAYAGPGGWNDPDMLEVGNGNMTNAEYRSHFSIWAIMKAPLIIGNDVRNMTEETFTILSNREVIAVNQDPLGVQARKMRQVKGLEVWAGPLSGNRVVIALWNKTPIESLITARWKDIGLPSVAVATARDLWQHQNLQGVYRTSLTTMVPSHDVAMFVLNVTIGS
eukprot:SM000019S04926  [mRNA]  locus=s19:494:4556:+ [translate_table: standard]